MSDLHVVPYRGYGTADVFYLQGRVLKDKGSTAPAPTASVIDNLVAAYRRLESDEAAGVQVLATFAGETWTAITNHEGYFDLVMTPQQAIGTASIWHTVTVQLAGDDSSDGSSGYNADDSARTTGQILTPPPTAAFGVISDIDDTVLVSHATSMLKAVLTAILNNAQTRSPFPGVPAFYRALQAGPGGDGYNPVFYVSSSPWNFYDLLTEFMAIHAMPAGPLFLRDYGLQSLVERGHKTHKLARIEQLLTTYPALPFILLGDSGQEDPEIYAAVAARQPGRIRAVYIRDVTRDERRVQVEALGAKIEAAGADFVQGATEDFAAHATAYGLISALQATKTGQV
jgi:phosphatidate phosphatase APP1